MPSFINATSLDLTSSGDKNIPIPSGTSVGDRLLVQVSGRNHTVNTLPSDWVQIESKVTTTDATQTVITGIYNGSTPVANISIPGSGREANLIVLTFSDADTVDVSNQFGESSAGTTHITNPITPSDDGAMVVALFTGDANIIVGEVDAPFTERVDYEYWGHNYAATYAQGTAASISSTMTSSESQAAVCMILALLPAGGGGSLLNRGVKQLTGGMHASTGGMT